VDAQSLCDDPRDIDEVLGDLPSEEEEPRLVDHDLARRREAAVDVVVNMQCGIAIPE
jgi:hypothetical protein